MNYLTCCGLKNLLVLLLFFFTLYKNVAQISSALVEIKDDTYSKLVGADDGGDEVWLIMFYAPWCHHCHKVRPIFEQLALSSSMKVRYGVIDATINKKSTTENQVTRFPTIKYFVKSVYSSLPLNGSYSGPRTLEALQIFVSNILSTPFAEVSTLEDISLVSNRTVLSHTGNDVVFLLNAPSFKNLVSLPEVIRNALEQTTVAFKSVASRHYFHASFAILDKTFDTMSDIEEASRPYFYISKVEIQPDSSTLRTSMQIRPPSKYIHHPFLCINKACTYSDIENFIQHENQPLISTLDNHNFKQFSHLDKVLIILVDKFKESSLLVSFQAAAQAVSYKNKMEEYNVDKMMPVFGHLDGVRWRKFIKKYYVKMPAVLVIDFQHDHHRTFNLGSQTSHEKEVFSNIMEGVLEGTIEWETTAAPTLLQKIYYRVENYYPWSLIVLMLPVLLIVTSVCGTKYPDDKKNV